MGINRDLYEETNKAMELQVWSNREHKIYGNDWSE